MSTYGSQPPEHVPTLTEVVSWPEPAREPYPSDAVSQTTTVAAPAIEADVLAAQLTQTSVLNEEQIVERVLAEIERQVTLMLEYRLREVLTPLLTRAADNMVRDARTELASTLRDVVARAVSQELARHRVP